MALIRFGVVSLLSATLGALIVLAITGGEPDGWTAAIVLMTTAGAIAGRTLRERQDRASGA